MREEQISSSQHPRNNNILNSTTATTTKEIKCRNNIFYGVVTWYLGWNILKDNKNKMLIHYITKLLWRHCALNCTTGWFKYFIVAIYFEGNVRCASRPMILFILICFEGNAHDYWYLDVCNMTRWVRIVLIGNCVFSLKLLQEISWSRELHLSKTDSKWYQPANLSRIRNNLIQSLEHQPWEEAWEEWGEQWSEWWWIVWSQNWFNPCLDQSPLHWWVPGKIWSRLSHSQLCQLSPVQPRTILRTQHWRLSKILQFQTPLCCSSKFHHWPLWR